MIACLLALGFGSTPAKADFIMSIGDYRQTSALGGTFEITLSNTDNKSYDVAGFNFQLTLPSSSGVRFTGASTATVAHAYLLNGTGSATVDPDFQFSYDPFPNTTFTASDTEFTFPSIAVKPGSSFGLGLVTYAISPSAPTGSVPISFVSIGTGLSDAAGNAIPFTTRNGSIQPSAVPEPTSFVLFAIATTTIAAIRRLGCVGLAPPE